VREAWFGMMLGHFCGANRSAGQTAAALMLDALRTRNRDQFEQALIALFAGLPYDLHVNREAFYHSVFFAALQATGGEIIAEPNGCTSLTFLSRKSIRSQSYSRGCHGKSS